MRCAFHGWLFDVDGKCLQTPAEPDDSNLCANIRQKAYPVVEKSGILFAYMGPGEPPAFPHFDCFVAPATHTFAFKGMIDCNWLQSLEVGIDPVHTSFLHRFFHDEDPSQGYGKMFRDTVARHRHADDADHARVSRARASRSSRPTSASGWSRCARSATQNAHVRVTNLMFPNAFIIPMSREMTITQWHVPIDDAKHYWYAIFTCFGAAGDKDEMRRQRLELYRIARLHAAQEQEQRLRLRSARAGARDLHRHGRRHQRARPVGLRIDGRDPGPHPGASRHVRQGDQPPTAGCCGRRSSRSGKGDRPIMVLDAARAAVAHRPGRRSTASARPTTGRAIGSKTDADQAQRRELGQWAVSLGVIVREGGRSSNHRTFD